MITRIAWLGLFYLWNRVQGSELPPCNIPDSGPVETNFFIEKCFLGCKSQKYKYPVCKGNSIELCDEKQKCSIGHCQKVPCTCIHDDCRFQFNCFRYYQWSTVCFEEHEEEQETEVTRSTAETNYTKKIVDCGPDVLGDVEPLYERAWPSVLPIFLMILFSTLLFHYCRRCHKKNRRAPLEITAPSAPIAPSSPLLSRPLVVTFASIHSNPFEQHMTPHAASMLMQSVIREADPRARRPIAPFLQLQREVNPPQPSAPSAELVITPLAARPRNMMETDLPPPYHLALQLEEPPPPYSESNNL